MSWIPGKSKKFCSMICLGLRIGFRAGKRGSAVAVAVAVAVAAALSQTRFEAHVKRSDSGQILFLSHSRLSVVISVVCSMNDSRGLPRPLSRWLAYYLHLGCVLDLQPRR